MASFIEDLWGSIFTPGPTSPLVAATNVAFAALQLVLLALLVATNSIHFYILSFLSAALWAAINWFVKEVRVAQAAQDAQAQSVRQRPDSGSDDDTEVEDSKRLRPKAPTYAGAAASGAARTQDVSDASGQVPMSTVGARNRGRLTDSTGDLSTDSEWEKVDQE